MKNSSLNLVFQKCRSVHHQHWSEWHNYLHIAIYCNPRYPRVCGVCQAVLHSLTAWIMPFVSVNEILHVAIQMRLPQRYSTNCKDWKSYLGVWRFKLNIFPSTLFFNFFQREIFYYIEFLFYFNVNNFQEWKGSFQSFFFSEVPSWADCFESKAVWYWTSQGCTETCFTASRPWWYWKDSASIETGKKKKKIVSAAM